MESIEIGREEAEHFARMHGIIPLREIREKLAKALDWEQQPRLHEIHNQLSPLEEAIKEMPAVQRLNQLYQLGGKTDPELINTNGQAQAVTPAFHTRYQHSELIAELAKVAGVKMGMSTYNISHSFAAGWLHDVGHSAFSHGGDDLLIRNGYSNHEDRGIELIQRKLKSSLESQGIDIFLLISIIEEKEVLGALQKILDTLSYLVTDSGMIGQLLYEDYGAKVLKNMVGFDEDNLVVKEVDVMQEFLDYRAMMSKEVYYSLQNKMIDGARARLLEIAVKKGCLVLDEVRDEGDGKIQMKLQSLVQPDWGAAMFGGRKESSTPLAKYANLFPMIGGFFNSKEWEIIQYETEKQTIESLFKRRTVLGSSFFIKPYDYTNKSLNICDQQGRKYRLKTEVELNDHDRKYVLFTPRIA